MKVWLANKTKAIFVALLSLVMSVLCLFGLKMMTVKTDADVTLVTGQDMVLNQEKLLPAFNHGGSDRLSITADGTISNYSDGHFIYKEEVYGVSLEMSVTASTQIAMALRTTGDGAMWGSYGYYAFIDSTNLWICKTDAETLSAWLNGVLLKTTSYGANLVDGNRHTVEFSAIENDAGNVVLSFKVDDNTAITVIDEGTPLSITGTAFKMATVNPPNPAIQVYGGIEYTAITVDDMLKNPEKLIGFNQGMYTFMQYDSSSHYEDPAVEAIDLDISLEQAGQLFFAFRTPQVVAPWHANVGYYFMFQVSGQNASVSLLIKREAVAGANWEQIGGGIVTNFFDGNRHKVEAVAVDYGSSATLVALTVDGVSFISYMDKTPIKPEKTTRFSIISGDGTARLKLWGTNGADAPELFSSVALDDALELNFFVNKAHAEYYNATSISVTDGEKTVWESAISEVKTRTVDGKVLYEVNIPVFPKNYKQEFTMNVNNADGVVFSLTNSVEKYLNSEELATLAQGNAKLANLVEATKVYCESARAYFAGETVATVETNVDVSAYGITVEGAKLPVGIKGVKSNLILESGVELRIYFTFAEGANVQGVTVNGKALTKKPGEENVYYASIDGITVLDFETAQTFVITDGVDTVTMGISVLSYAKQALASSASTDNLKNVVKALVNYQVCATAYNA